MRLASATSPPGTSSTPRPTGPGPRHVAGYHPAILHVELYSAEYGPGHELRVAGKAVKVTAALDEQRGHGDPERVVGGERRGGPQGRPRSRG